jgi:isoleucyl-tRNA synthetase
VATEIATELNVKALEDVDTLSGLLTWTVVPSYRVLGPRLGPAMNDVKQALAAADGSALQRQLEAEGWIEVAGHRLEAAEVELRATRHEDFALAEDAGWAVALDLELTEELRQEGTARELVRALNDLRKEVGLEIADRVAVTLDGDAAVTAAVEAHEAWIAGEVLAVALTVGDPGPGAHRLELDDRELRVSLARA